MEFLESKRGCRMVLYNNFKYNFGSTSKKDGSTRWRCVTRTCSALIYSDKNDIFLSTTGEHNHESYDITNIHRQIINVGCKRKAVEDMHIQPKKVVLKEIAHNDHAASTFTVNDINRLRKNIYKARKSVLPPNPTNINEVHTLIDTERIITTRGESFLLVNDKNKNVLIFSCEKNLLFLNQVENIYVDGTFKYASRFFSQMFTLHGFKNGHYIPLVFCLLIDKSVKTYEFVFTMIVEKCNTLGFLFSPKNITVDFELAIHKAIENVWPNTTIIGCRFHLTQSWWRNIQKCGLTSFYKDDSSEIGKWIRYTFGLVFLNPDEVSNCFVEDLLSDCPVNDKLTNYCDYLTDTYISEDSLFPPSIWASNTSELIRTTNACESFHSFFNKSFNHISPPISAWLSIINEIQTEVYIKLNSLHLQRCPKDKKIIDRQQKNEEKIQKYKAGTINRYDFIKSMSFNYSI